MKPSTFEETVALAFNIHKVFKLTLYNMFFPRWHSGKLCQVMEDQQETISVPNEVGHRYVANF